MSTVQLLSLVTSKLSQTFEMSTRSQKGCPLLGEDNKVSICHCDNETQTEGRSSDKQVPFVTTEL